MDSSDPFENIYKYANSSGSMDSRPEEVRRYFEDGLLFIQHSSFNSAQRILVKRMNKLILNAAQGELQSSIGLPSTQSYISYQVDKLLKDSTMKLDISKILCEYFYLVLRNLIEKDPSLVHTLKALNATGIIEGFDSLILRLYAVLDNLKKGYLLPKLKRENFIMDLENPYNQDSSNITYYSECPFKNTSRSLIYMLIESLTKLPQDVSIELDLEASHMEVENLQMRLKILLAENNEH